MTCQYKVGTGNPVTRPCRAMSTFEVVETIIPARPGLDETRGWFGIGEFCTGHAITVCAGTLTRAMRPLAATYETMGKR